MTILVTGGAGFIGSNFIVEWFKSSNEQVINIDKLTYASNHNNLINNIETSKSYKFIHGDICDGEVLKNVFKNNEINAVFNFAAESHVDRSIINPEAFIQTNIVGTYKLLQVSYDYLKNNSNDDFRFIHVSTDEVYGNLEENDPPFQESNAYRPNSPYSASKAASDHLARAFNKTYGLPVIISNCSNNYGPFQFPEKLIPLAINNALKKEAITIYGDGNQIRDWLYVKDHCSALRDVLLKGVVGKTYNIGGNAEKTNNEVVHMICDILDELCPREDNLSYKEQITYIKDRPGHDRRYSVDCSMLMNTLNWSQVDNFDTGIRKTIKWYLDNPNWLEDNQTKDLKKWIDNQNNSDKQ